MRAASLTLMLLMTPLAACGDKESEETEEADADTDADTDTDTAPTADTGTCPVGERPAGFYCQQAPCQYCVGSDCPTFASLTATLDVCDTSDTGFFNPCCEVTTCTDPVHGPMHKVDCGGPFGANLHYFDQATGELVTHAWSTDFNCCCNGQAFGQLYGPDIVNSCQ